jgi:hypothetical protein
MRCKADVKAPKHPPVAWSLHLQEKGVRSLLQMRCKAGVKAPKHPPVGWSLHLQEKGVRSLLQMHSPGLAIKSIFLRPVLAGICKRLLTPFSSIIPNSP